MFLKSQIHVYLELSSNYFLFALKPYQIQGYRLIKISVK